MGATASVGQITAFLEGIARSRGLRAAVVSDEAAGSTIIDELFERVVDPGVMIVRLRFAPEPTITLPPLAARTSCSRMVDAEEIRDPLMALRWLAIALRRCSRIHPILLVIEDLHKLGAALPGEFALFLASLADETLSVLCRSSRMDPSVRCVIERYLIEEILLDAPARSGVEPLVRGDDGWSYRREIPVAADDSSGGVVPHRSPALPTMQPTGQFFGKIPTELEPASGAMVGISMIGAITVRRPDGSTTAVRGARHGTILGVLVIDRMLSQPLSYREFCHLASGCVDDPLRAQKIMNMGVKRLQEMLGPEAITRDSETPRLNLELISVDLLEALRHLHDAVVTAGVGPLMRAVDQLGAALDVVERGGLFPGLDGDMFDAAREDFMGGVRSAVVEVARMIHEEGETGAIEAILRRAQRLLPEDAEISGLLAEIVSPAVDDLLSGQTAALSGVMQTETFLFATISSDARLYGTEAA